MTTTFLKRQKEMKRQEKAREKAERRKQKKLAKANGTDDSIDDTIGSADIDWSSTDLDTPNSDPDIS